MIHTRTLIIGASFSGLATAACLKKKNIAHIVLEKTGQVATPWRRHYERVHLHTNKSLSHLPYKKFAATAPRYPGRMQVINYLEQYQEAFGIRPLFGTEALSIRWKDDKWITQTTGDSFIAENIVMATGLCEKPKSFHFTGLQTFPGQILHSSGYRTGKLFTGKKVLVVGFGNSACEIAIDLYEQGAKPMMAVRSAVNIIPRDLLGIPIISIAQLMAKLPPKIADAINAPLIRMLYGDIAKLGLKKKPYGTFQQIKKDKRIPLLDIGTVAHIRKGNIKVFGDISHISGNRVSFSSGESKDVDVIVAATGYESSLSGMLQMDQELLEDLAQPISRQKYFGKDGLFFCGFYVSPTGMIHEIAKEARMIARHISRKQY